MLILSATLTLPFELTTVDAASVSSPWTRTSDSEFSEGILSNVTIVGESPNAELRLDLTEYHEWTEITLQRHPSDRFGHGMVSVWGTDNIVLFGGYDGTPRNDTWIYNSTNNTWFEVTPQNPTQSNNPSPRYIHAMVSIHGEDKVMLFGGKNQSSELNDTWVYDLSSNTWSEKTPIKPIVANNPTARKNHAMSTIYGTDKVILFGGWDGEFNDETWIYDLSDNTWTNKEPVSKPIARYNHAMVSIYGKEIALLFGGTMLGAQSNETWFYDLTANTWTNLTPHSKLSRRFGHAITPINASDQVLLFGGYDVSNDNETWVYRMSDNTWNLKTPASRPPPRRGHTLAPIYGTNQSVLFGGATDVKPYGDTWAHDLFLGYLKMGTYISKPYESGPDSTFKYLSWDAIISANTTLKFQLRSAATQSNLTTTAFVGPDGSTDTYYSASPSVIWSDHENDSWIQYKVYFNTDNVKETPRLKEVTISNNYLPVSALVSPDNRHGTMNNKPSFVWSFNDPDSTLQSAFQVLIDDDIDFTSMDYDSGGQISVNQYWDFPSGTGYTSLADGSWYWKVRTRDNENDWGYYSAPWLFTIDTIPPNCSVLINNGDEYTNSTFVTLTLGSDDSGTGVSQMAFSTDNAIWSTWEAFNLDRSYILPSNDGEKTLYFKVKDLAGNIADTVFDTIVLDTTPPHSVSILINDGASETNSTLVTLNLSALDDSTGISEISFSVNGINWSSWEPFIDEKNFTLPALDGEKTVYFRVKDNAGNIAEPVITSIVLKTSEPNGNGNSKPSSSGDDGDKIWIFLGIVILCVVVIIVLLRVRKGKPSKELMADSKKTTGTKKSPIKR